MGKPSKETRQAFHLGCLVRQYPKAPLNHEPRQKIRSPQTSQIWRILQKRFGGCRRMLKLSQSILWVGSLQNPYLTVPETAVEKKWRRAFGTQKRKLEITGRSCTIRATPKVPSSRNAGDLQIHWDLSRVARQHSSTFQIYWRGVTLGIPWNLGKGDGFSPQIKNKILQNCVRVEVDSWGSRSWA